jgi:hypothetical protein
MPPLGLAGIGKFSLENSTSFHAGAALSGCTPKFVLEHDHNKYLFKPSSSKHHALNELMAFLVDRHVGFDRTPPVQALGISVQATQTAIEQHVSKKLLNCNMDLSSMNGWIRRRDSDMIIGTVQLLVPFVSKRNDLVQLLRSSGVLRDTRPSIFAQRELGTRALFDFILGNWDRYNNDFVQTNDNGDRLLVYIDQGGLVLSGRDAFSLDEQLKHCRVYWKPVERLRQTMAQGGLRASVVGELRSNEVTSQWIREGLVDVSNHPTLANMNRRVKKALAQVDACVAQHGADRVFLNLDTNMNS